MIDSEITLQDRKPLLSALSGKQPPQPPFWFMRQAGRYLPEYRDLRSKSGGFLDMVFSPDLACEITMQPLRRFDMDGAILFADILTIPYALDQSLEFVTGEGPKLDPVRCAADMSKLTEAFAEHRLKPVYETVSRVSAALAEEGFDDTALIGFCGAPWTVACYMVEGGSSRDFRHIKKWSQNDPEGFETLIECLVWISVIYLSGQIEAGAEAVQIFDSWAGILSHDEFETWVIEPTAKITAALKGKYPHIPVIGFPRNAGALYSGYIDRAGVDAVGLDQGVALADAAELQRRKPVQGNLDPALVMKGGSEMETQARRIIETLGGAPFVFNLGHGIDKETPVENVERLAGIIRKSGSQ